MKTYNEHKNQFLTHPENVGKYFIDFDGIIKIVNISSDFIYNYIVCEFEDNGNIIETTETAEITPQQLKYFEEI